MSGRGFKRVNTPGRFFRRREETLGSGEVATDGLHRLGVLRVEAHRVHLRAAHRRPQRDVACKASHRVHGEPRLKLRRGGVHSLSIAKSEEQALRVENLKKATPQPGRRDSFWKQSTRLFTDCLSPSIVVSFSVAAEVRPTRSVTSSHTAILASSTCVDWFIILLHTCSFACLLKFKNGEETLVGQLHTDINDCELMMSKVQKQQTIFSRMNKSFKWANNIIQEEW